MNDRTHRFKMFSADYFRVINQTGVRQRIGLGGVDYFGCWDINLSPDGILYYAASDESGRARHTRLLSYDYQTDTAKICLRAEDVVLPKTRQLPVTKFHESICFLPDGRIFGITHSTDRAPQHPEWMPLAHHTHIWEGWPGSTMVCYDPKTGKAENWGIPVPHTAIEDSKIIGLVWDERNLLHGVCGENTKYCFSVTCDGKVREFAPLDDLDSERKKWLLSNIHPKSFDLDKDIKLPHVAGRQYLAKPSAVCGWNGGRKIVGTKDGLLSVINGGDVYSLGNAAAHGPVRALFVNGDKTRLWGTAGDEEDLGTVFYYDDKAGLRQLGFLIYNIHGYFDGPSASNILSSIVVSEDERFIAVGGADRIGSIHIARLK